MSLILLNVSVTVFILSELLRENQQVGYKEVIKKLSRNFILFGIVITSTLPSLLTFLISFYIGTENSFVLICVFPKTLELSPKLIC